MELKTSRHVPRAHRIHFEGNPESGRIEVRCASEQDFTMVRTEAGWVVILGSGFPQSVHPGIRPHSNPYIVYLRAVKVLWGTDLTPTFEFFTALL